MWFRNADEINLENMEEEKQFFKCFMRNIFNQSSLILEYSLCPNGTRLFQEVQEVVANVTIRGLIIKFLE